MTISLLKWPEQDRSVEHVCGDKTKRPSEADGQLQVEKANSVWKNELDIEDGHLVVIQPSTAADRGKRFIAAPTAAETVVSAKAKAKAKRAPKAKAAASGGIGLLAAQLRAKSASDFVAATSALKRAKAAGDTLLDVTAPQLLGADKALIDPSLSLVRSRLRIVELALHDHQRGPNSQECSDLYMACMEDVYLKDLESSVFKDKSAVQTVGVVTYVRNVIMELQPHKAALDEVSDSNRSAITALKKMAEALTTEVESWRTHTVAIRKAHEQERKALEKAEKKLQTRKPKN